MPASTRTAAEAAAACDCAVDQIVKSLVFRGAASGALHLLLVAGGNRVGDGAGALLGEPLERADPAEVRARTGFAIGGVAPLGHHEPPRVAMDPALLTFDLVWAAAGSPRHVFSIAPSALQRITGARLVPLAE